MRMEINRTNVWVVNILDQPGALAEKLEALAQADIDLEFINARRAHDKPGYGLVYVLSIKGAHQIRAARKAGFEIAKSLHGISIVTGNKPGFSSELARLIAKAGVNIRAFSAASFNNQAIFYIALDSDADATKVINLLKD